MCKVSFPHNQYYPQRAKALSSHWSRAGSFFSARTEGQFVVELKILKPEAPELIVFE